MDVDMNELEKLAKAATPGERTAVETNMGWRVSTDPGFMAMLYYRCDKIFEIAEREAAADAAFIAAANPQTVLALIQMVRSAYSRALRDVREAMRVAQAEGRAPACGCDSHGFEPGCMVHDPTAVPLGREG